MDFLKIYQTPKLSGHIDISGAKNSALPILTATLLSQTPLTISNLPNVADVNTLLKLLEILGAEYQSLTPHRITINTQRVRETKATYDIVRKMRASILVLGPLLARFGHCEVSLPGGCAIGARPVDLHIKAMEKMGAKVDIQNGYIVAQAPQGLKGATIVFDKITVTGTENVLMAASLAKGKTKIINAAKEPEVIQLCEILQNAGVSIEGIGTHELEIIGSDGELLKMQDIAVIPDRIEAGTYLCAGAITNSSITLNKIIPHHLEAITDKLQEIGFGFEITHDSLTLLPAPKRKAFEITTTEYPGFPTDMQAQFMALALVCEGISSIEEKLFENRFMHVSELQRMGANITLKGHTANIIGGEDLKGADVMATDLRASSALVLAGLVAQGSTQVHRIYHLDRGYEKLEIKLQNLGAKIERLKE
ncbi:UDP-N-acetylglucosamine 1-carboxyvinyltransferase [Helicobacter kayseriensis]|uniref:UDP-N-acetylglucosamine 1-carboxyvinyltransferase n=1 Tax=Helicobacter kayseriensis TaxID=2905877 RepID=UPI001E4CD577|nr:UDP-N-acetylglucosamine 1-carboxyvinyltransferase [Helicobacter kayseriensis]MCE3047256.1 UDP-N-acetylglucosamine 1-carboxyvinyltransferase [Helicobacter kayseriensis]MCE3048627.1 UDP-N-acetylglucosamine 1-carboxyvinyltransferase [Helicobacter kayseriensis]